MFKTRGVSPVIPSPHVQMTCTIVEWDGSGGLGPEAMFFKPNSGAEFEVWAVSNPGCFTCFCTGFHCTIY